MGWCRGELTSSFDVRFSNGAFLFLWFCFVVVIVWLVGMSAPQGRGRKRAQESVVTAQSPSSPRQARVHAHSGRLARNSDCTLAMWDLLKLP